METQKVMSMTNRVRAKSRLWVVFLCSALGVALVAESSWAQAPKYTRQTKVKTIKVKQTERTKKIEPKEKKASEVRPEISADDFMATQGKVRQIRKEQIKLYRQLIADTDPDDPQLPDYLFRLADAYAQQQRYWRLQAGNLYAAIDKAKGGQKNALKNKQKNYQKAEREYLVQSLKVYKALTANPKFRNYPNMDQALFYYAFTLQGAKYIGEARTVYKTLIKNYPKSKYIPEAYLAFADYFFNENQLANAEKFYDKVLEFPKSPVYAYAMYKKGWVYLNQTKWQLALETFFNVANLTNRDKKRSTLNKAAKKDIVRAYAEIGQPAKALNFFKRVDSGYAPKMLEILADTYLDQGKSEKAIFTYRELISEMPKDQKVCEWQYNIVRGMLSVGNEAQKVEEVERLVKLYGAYKTKGVLKGSYLSECRENAQETTSELAKVWHNEAIKTLNPETLAYVEKLYKVYIEVFSDADDVSEMQYYYAELLWQRAESEKNQRLATELWERAAMAFTDVVKAGKLDAKMKKEAAYAAVLGWKNALAVDPRTKAPPSRDLETSAEAIPKPKPIPEREQKMIEAFDVYINYIKDPKDEELVMMKFLKARIYWRADHLEDSAPIFQDIIDNHIDHETAEYSANILLDSYIRLQQYDKMLALANSLLARKSFLEDKEDLSARLRDIQAKAERKRIEKLEKDGQWVACGEGYSKIYNANPDGEGMDEVLYNAGVCYENGKSIGLAIYMFKLLQKRFPGSNQAQKALVRLGNNFGAIAYYDEAAEMYEAYAKKYGGEKDASKALSNAVLYRKGIGDDDKAIADTRFFVKQYKNKLKEESADALFSMSGIYEKRNERDNLVKHLESYLREMGRQGGADRVVVAHAKIGQVLWEQSCPTKGVDGACVKVTRERALRASKKKKRSRGVQLPTQCGPESKIKLEIVNRDRGKAAKAKANFKKAIAAFGNGKVLDSIPGDGASKALRQAQATYWYAAANFYLAEEKYEDFLAVKFPTGLNFDPRNEKKAAASNKEFAKWLDLKKKKLTGTESSYGEIVNNIRGGGAHWAIASAARIGQIYQNFGDGLYTAEIPKNVRTGPYAEDAVDAYCDALTTAAEPLENKSVEAFSFCLTNTTKLNWFNEWSKLCEKELGQIRPQDFPTAAETHSSPNMVAPITDTQGIIAEIQ